MGKDINESVEKIFLYKGNLIKNNKRFRQHVRSVLNEQGIKDTRDTVKAFVMGAVDGMIYDIACSLGFTKQKCKARERKKF